MKGPGNWGLITWQVDPKVLQQGPNNMTITNLSAGSSASEPFVALDQALIAWSAGGPLRCSPQKKHILCEGTLLRLSSKEVRT